MRRGRLRPPRDPESIFDAFVRNAVGGVDATRSLRAVQAEVDAPLPDWMDGGEDEHETTSEIVLLTKVKPPHRAGARRPSTPRSDDTMQLEAMLAVPDVRSIEPPPLPVREGSEDGQIPAGELDRVLGDMMVLARYGHFDEVRARLEAVTRKYPEDVLLLRRVVELYIELGDRYGAIESLFTLALRLFERRNVIGMRQALEQVLVIEPDNRRAYKLLGLLDERPSTGTGG